jgi:hypothetical protein
MLYILLNCTFAERPLRPGPCSPAATSITVARPGHNCDCVQAPVRLVACRAAGVVTCSRLVVCKICILPWARGPVTVPWQPMHTQRMTDGMPVVNSSSAGWEWKVETRAVSRLITAMTRNVTRDAGIPCHPMLNGPQDPEVLPIWNTTAP